MPAWRKARVPGTSRKTWKSSWALTPTVPGGRARGFTRWTRPQSPLAIQPGLYSGSACAGQGVAYNALRMARTEIQYVHGQATDYAMAKMPWIDEERIYLSRAHPEPDICDDVVNGGRGGKGIYPVGTIVLPLHPHCLCGKEALQPDPASFVKDLRAWMQGGSSSNVSEYAALFGKNQNSLGSWTWRKGSSSALSPIGSLALRRNSPVVCSRWSHERIMIYLWSDYSWRAYSRAHFIATRFATTRFGNS